MRYLLFIAIVFLVATVVSAYPGEFGSPAAPQNIQANSVYAHYDVQIHSANRDNPLHWDTPMAAQHGSACQGPPSTHTVDLIADSVFICNDHVMTSANAISYGEIVITPSQVMNCTAGCSVQWDMSTERMSTRDWPDVWLTPWDDNLTLPIEPFLPDLQGMPRRGIHVGAQGNNNSWAVSMIDNYAFNWQFNPSYLTMNDGIQAGVNQSAVRQTFKLTVTPGHLRFERLASATAPLLVFVDENAPVLLAPDYVVQFAQHSYNPTKEGAGVPATWHWSNFNLSNATPFTLIHSAPANVAADNTLVTFDAPAPANAYLRFSGKCAVKIDGNVAPKQTFTGHPESTSSYFIPIAQGKQSVVVSFAPDDWYSGPCSAQDFHVWSKGGPPPSTPTSVPSTATPTQVVPPTATSSPVVPTPTATSTPTVTPPSPTLIPPTPTPSPTSTAIPPTSTPTVVPPTPTATPPPVVCNMTYYRNDVLTKGPVIPCP